MSTVVGLFDQYNDAERAVNSLEQYGIRNDKVSLVKRDGEGLDHEGSKAGKGAVAGAATGGVLGLLAGVGALAIPGIGPVLATGAIASAIGTALGMTAVGAGVGAATGGLLGALMHAGVSHDEASFYSEGVKRGGVLVTVDAKSDQEERVREILRSSGAVNMDSRRQSWEKEGWSRFEENENKDAEVFPTRRM